MLRTRRIGSGCGGVAKFGGHEIVSGERVDRAVADLALRSPLKDLIDLERVGQDIRATTIVTGEVIDYRIDPGSPAPAAVRVVAYDVASGAPVSGAISVGVAVLRSRGAKDAALREAIGRAAFTAMRGRQVPTARIVNTTTRAVTINRGTKSGFQTGMVVIVTRGPVQLGTGRVGQVEAKHAEVLFERSGLIAPGDRVRTVFNPPALGISILDNPPPARPQ